MTENLANGLYHPSFEHDSCGFGLIANLDDKPSHWLVETAITALSRLTHRGAVAADGKTGDGCGLLIKSPESFLRAVAEDLDIRLAERFAAGTVFLSQDPDLADKVKSEINAAIRGSELVVAGWRTMPVNPDVCGELAKRTLPRIEQVFVNAPEGMQRSTFNRQLFLARRRAEKKFVAVDPTAYVASLSSVTISYKAMVMPDILPEFYADLRDPRLESSVCVFHQRFSTNTMPEWQLPTFARFRPLCDLDLNHLGVNQVFRRHAEAARCDLLDLRHAFAVVTGRILAALARIRSRPEPVHRDCQRLVSLRR